MTQKFGRNIFHTCLDMHELYYVGGEKFISREGCFIDFIIALFNICLEVSIQFAKQELCTISTIILNIIDCLSMKWNALVCAYLIPVVSDNRVKFNDSAKLMICSFL